jgi:acyl transferase domain-containing protein/NADP-dependent 3-hydroxy acid dehydrogenase YdfG/acyl carrier protein
MLGEGIAMFALKRLADAERDGDHVYAVIRGVGTSSDGRGGAIYAPLPEGQARALRRAYEAAGYGPGTVELVEAHGTGTRAGDTAEFAALREVFDASGREDRQWCALGSVKSQIGHTKSAAGAAGLLKAVLAVHHQVLPPTIKVDRPNAALQLGSSPFYLSTKARPWTRAAGHPRRASVSSFGFGGTNFHVTLEEYRPAGRSREEYRPAARSGARTAPRHSAAPDLVLLSAGSPGELLQQARRLDVGRPLADVARGTRQEFRPGDPARLAVVADSAADLAAKLATAVARIEADGTSPLAPPPLGPPAGPAAGRVHVGTGPARAGRVGFLFPGQGSQYVGMGADLAMHMPQAQAVWDRAAGRDLGDVPLHRVVFPPPAAGGDDQREQERRLTATEWAQPALAVHSAALLAVLSELGLRPDCVAGHSFGELVALHAAGAFDVDTLAGLGRRRGELMRDAAAAAPGAMLAVATSWEEAEAAAGQVPGVWPANHNAPRQVVLAGSRDALGTVATRLEASGVSATWLNAAAAFHSPLVAGATRPLADFLATTDLRAPVLEVYGGADARAYPADPDELRRRLAAQLTAPVRFHDVIEAMYTSGVRTFVEVGPGATLTGLTGQILGDREHAAICLDRRGRPGFATFLDGLGRLAARGAAMDFSALDTGRSSPGPEPTGKEPAGRQPRMTVKIGGGNYGRPYPPPDGATASAGDSAPAAGAPPRQAAEAPRQATDGTRADPGPAPAPQAPRAPAPAAPAGAVMPAAQAVPVTPTAPSTPVAPAAQARPITPSAPSIPVPDGERAATPAPTRADEGWLRIIEAAQQETAAAQASFQQAMTDSHLAYLRLAQTTITGLLGMSMGETPAAVPLPGRPADVTAVPLARPPGVPGAMPGLPGAGPDTPGAVPGLPGAVPGVPGAVAGVPGAVAGLPGAVPGLPDAVPGVPGAVPGLPDAVPGVPGAVPGVPGAVPAVSPAVTAMPPAPRSGHPAGPSAAPGIPGEPPTAPGTLGQPPTAPNLDAESLGSLLLSVVAERTGFPAEMLNVDMDLEADLGIDSIKKVEILSTIREQAGGDMPGLDLAAFASLRTLRAIAEKTSELGAATTADRAGPDPAGPDTAGADTAGPDTAGADTAGPDMAGADTGPDTAIAAIAATAPADEATGPTGATGPAASVAAPQAGAGPQIPADQEHVPLSRLVARAVPAPPSGLAMLGLTDGPVTVTDDGTGVAPLLADRLAGHGIRAEVVTSVPAGARSVIILDGLRPISSADDAVAVNEAAFRAARQVARQLEAAGGVFVTVQDTGGDFGLDGGDADRSGTDRSGTGGADPEHAWLSGGNADRSGRGGADPERAWLGGLAGLARTAGAEWPRVSVKAIDCARADWAPDLVAAAIADELITGGPATAVGLRGDGTRVTLGLEAAPVRAGRAPVSEKSVIVATGGARGITAAAMRALAREYRPRLLLLGSRPLTAEPGYLSGAPDEASLIQLLAGRQGGRPAEIAAAAHDVLAAREIRGTLSAIEETGASVRYLPVDVRDTRAVAGAVAQARRSWGPVTGVVHGAGLLADSLIADKTDEQFRQVLSTKVDGLRALLDATAADPLDLLCAFSSIAAYAGNPGQSDYAMANEVLNQVLTAEQARRPGCLVRSIAWGPWHGGMVTPQIAERFRRRGVPLIDPQAGARAFLAELGDPGAGPRVILAAGGTGGLAPPGAGTLAVGGHAGLTPPGAGSLAAQLTVAAPEYAHLADHEVAGVAVVPVATVLDWFVGAARAWRPEAGPVVLRDVRVLNKIALPRLADGGHRLVLRGHEATGRDGPTLDLDLRGDADLPHYRASVLTSAPLPRAGTWDTPRDLQAAQDLYDGITLFHGPKFRAIRAARGVSAAGAEGTVVGSTALGWAPSPWRVDPAAVDGGLQLAVLWAQQAGAGRTLPMGVRECRVYREGALQDAARCVVHARQASDSGAECDVALVGADGAPLIELLGVQLVRRPD